MRTIHLAVCVLAAAAACSVINDYERLPTPAAGGSGGDDDEGAGGQGGSASGMGSGGELPDCNDAACEGASTDCMACSCLQGLICHCQPVVLGAPCRDGAGCDGTGSCVQCLEDTDCAPDTCDTHICVGASCQDETLNGNETDVDCGGNNCAPCDIGDDCDVALDCHSRYCAAGGVCQPCEQQAHCGDFRYCDLDTNVCDDKKRNATSCENDYECVSGYCGSAILGITICGNP